MIVFSSWLWSAERNGDGDPRSFAARNVSNFELAPKEGGAFAHTEQAHGFGVGDFFFADAAAIVYDLHDDLLAIGFETNRHMGGPGVTDDIGQGFLENAEKGGVQFLIQQRNAEIGDDIAFNAGAILKFVGLPFQRRGKA